MNDDDLKAYWKCTDCGVDTWGLGETVYTVTRNVWEVAYPGYSLGVGVGSSRPCIGCLESRLGRTLTTADFILPTEPQPGLSDRLNQRLMNPANKLTTPAKKATIPMPTNQ